MKLCVIGISPKTAPTKIREKIFFRPMEREIMLGELKSRPEVLEAMILSTCNRIEVYVSLIDDKLTGRALMAILARVKKIPLPSVAQSLFYEHHDGDCVRHLMRVITGLDSIVIGERQILGQIKEATELSRAKGMFSKQFNILTAVAIRAGKKAQTETEISGGGGSVSWAAVKTVENQLKTITEKSFLIIGAGKMSALTAEQLHNKKVKQLYIMNRTKEKALSLAQQLGGEPIAFSEIKEILNSIDVCICSASAPHYLIDHELLSRVMQKRQNRPIICVDISTPRNIDPKVSTIPGVTLYSIDDLDKVVQENMEKRLAAIGQVEDIIEKKFSDYYLKLAHIENFEKANSALPTTI